MLTPQEAMDKIKRSNIDTLSDVELDELQSALFPQKSDEDTDKITNTIFGKTLDGYDHTKDYTPKAPTNCLENPSEEWLEMQTIKPGKAIEFTNNITGEKTYKETESEETDNIISQNTNVFEEPKFNTDIKLDQLFSNGFDVEKAFDMIADLEEMLSDKNVSTEDSKKLLYIIDQVKNKKITIGIYNSLPDKFKMIIDTQCMLSQKSSSFDKEKAAVTFLNDIAQKLYKGDVDLESIIIKQVSDPNAFNDRLIAIKEKMEVGLIERSKDPSIDRIESKRLRESSAAFTSAYTYDFIYKRIENRVPVKFKGKKLTLKQELDHDLPMVVSYCIRFYKKYETSKFAINNIIEIPEILIKHLDYTEDELCKFTIFLCKAFATKKVSNIVDHTLMYWTIKMIGYIDLIKEESEFKTEILTNLDKAIAFILNYDK